MLKITNGSISYGNESIIEEINFELYEKDKVAIVGRNGCGKSSFLKSLINLEILSEGIGKEAFKIEKSKNITIGFLEQNAIKNEEHTLEEELLIVYKEILDLEKKIKAMEENIKNYEEYERLMAQYKLLGGYEYLSEIDKILPKFGFFTEDKKKTMKEFSGGERTKIALIKLLLSKPDILLLDEPTNHLDINTIEWLEEYLKNYQSSLILVSHDRYLLDQIVNKVYEIEYGSMTKYTGNYTSYEKQKEENYKSTLKNYEMQQKEIARLKAIADRFRYKPSKAGMAMSKLKKIEQMTIIECPTKKDESNIKLKFPVKKESSERVLSLKNVEFGYHTILNKVNFEIHKKERIAIIGPNGSGKSTLLKTIMGIIPKKSGIIELGTHLEVAYFDQNFNFETEKRTVLEEMQIYLPEKNKEQLRIFLGVFLFTGNDVFKPIEVLSGGEKVRLSLAKIISKEPNFLILDEPTNHLDLLGKQALEKCLLNYEGTILFVSHDRYFIDKIANSLVILNNPSIFFRGTLKEYQKENEKLKEFTEKTQKEPKKEKKIKEKKKETKKIEIQIKQLETKLKQIEMDMLKEENYMDYQKMDSLQKEKQKIEEQIEELLFLWE